MAWVELETAKRILMAGSDGTPGVFETVIGFQTRTYTIKAVHFMNDLAQTVAGGAPVHGGDLLCQIIRYDKDDERTSEDELRADARLGPAFRRAFPQEMGPARVREIRHAVGLLLNHDGGIYQAGTQMASGLATHRLLLGFDGFRSLRLGPYLARCLSDEGRHRLASLFADDRDPYTRTLRPLLVDEAPLVDRHPPTQTAPAPTPFDTALGRRLSCLLSQPLTKPTLLRALALAASLGIVLKILGIGREGERPRLLALAADSGGPHRALRSEAVQAFQRGRDALDQRLASAVAEHESSESLFGRVRREHSIEISGTGARAAVDLLKKLRTDGEQSGIYWPDRFAVAVGRRAGCVLPLNDRAGWGTFLALTPELVEVLILMSVPPTGRPIAWAQLWRELRDDLGIIVGANATSDAEVLRAAGVPHASPQALRDNAALLLSGAVRRGAAHRRPDGGAEAVGTLA